MLAAEGMMRRGLSIGWLANQTVADFRLTGPPHDAAGPR